MGTRLSYTETHKAPPMAEDGPSVGASGQGRVWLWVVLLLVGGAFLAWRLLAM